MRAVLFASLLLTLAACHSLPEGERIGEEIAQRSIVHFAEVDANPPAYFDRTLLVQARVTGVCQNKGCWMQVADGDSTAMVRWEQGCGGKYAFPASAVGKEVLIQGSFYRKEISEADARHIEEEAGGTVAIERVGYEFNASAILIPR